MPATVPDCYSASAFVESITFSDERARFTVLSNVYGDLMTAFISDNDGILKKGRGGFMDWLRGSTRD